MSNRPAPTRMRTLQLILAVALLSAGVFGSLPRDWQRSALTATIAAVGATVPATPENTLAAKLQGWEDDLQRREAALAAAGGSGASWQSLALVILGGLLLVNYALDWRRAAKTGVW